ncbi:MAG: hypothetical protein HUU16_01625 [Candidatus Omnitrophica bacterium]|nr:hypothetical protein [Candidatus Omnitrophota bacterium]
MRILPCFVLALLLFPGEGWSAAGNTASSARTSPERLVAEPSRIPLPVIEDLINTGHFEEAERALASWDTGSRAPSSVATLQDRLKKAKAASDLFAKAEGAASQGAALKGVEREKRDQLIKNYVARGIQSLAERQYDNSEAFFQQAIQLDPECYDAKEGLKRVQEAKASAPKPGDEASVGELLLTEDTQAKPSGENAALAQAAELFGKGFEAEQAGDLDRASRLYQEVLRLFPNSEDAQLRLVAIESKREKASEAGSGSGDVVSRIKPVYEKGMEAFLAGDYQTARAGFSEVLRIAPDHAPSQQYLAQCDLLGKTDDGEAKTRSTTLVSSSREGAPINTSPSRNSFEVGRDLFSAGDLVGAREFLKDVPPDNAGEYETAQVYLMRIDKLLGEEEGRSVTAAEPPSTLVAANSDQAVFDPWLSTGAASSPQPPATPAWKPSQTTPALPEIASENQAPRSRSIEMAQAAPAVAPEPVPASAPQVTPESSPAAPIPSIPDYKPPATTEGQIQELIETGVRANERGDILTAYEMWQKAADLDPNNPTAQAFLEKYADSHAQAARAKEESTRRSDVDARVEDLLNTKTFVLEQDTPVNINSILSTMGAIADLQIITGAGVDGDINALRTTELTYRQFLDQVLSLNGYAWKRQPGTNIIEVTRDLVSKRFPLTEQQYQALKRLAMDHLGGRETDDYSEALREVILGKVEPRDIDATIPGRTFFLSKFNLELVVRDSSHNVELVEQFLQLYKTNQLQVENPPMLVETFRLPKSGGENLARIINLRLFGDAEFKSEFKDDQPYLVYDERSGIMIIRQTPEKLELVRRLMRDPKFVSQVTERELKARKFVVVPAEDRRSDTPDAVLRRQNQVNFTKQVFQSLLYGSQSIEEAAAEGRVMYPDLDEGTIDVVDMPDNLKKIEEYLSGITETTNLTRTVLVRRREVVSLGLALQGLVLGVRFAAGGPSRIGQQGNQNFGQNQQQFQQVGQFGLFGIIPVIITADVSTKQLIVSGFRLADLDKAEDLIERLDIAVEQVEVEVRLVELSYNSDDSFGVTMTINNLLEIDDDDEPGPGFTLSDAAADFVSTPNSPLGSTLTLATLGRTTVDAALTMLSQFSEIRILTAPKLTVVSGAEGRVFLGEEMSFVDSIETTIPAGSDTPIVTSTIGRGEYGFELTTVPIVTGDGHIELDLEPSLEIPGDPAEIPHPITGDPIPVGEPDTDTREATLRVRVNDGDTLVIGGLLRRQLNHNEGRTPLFGYIPGLSTLFTQKADSETTQNLLILVTARIIPED